MPAPWGMRRAEGRAPAVFGNRAAACVAVVVITVSGAVTAPPASATWSEPSRVSSPRDLDRWPVIATDTEGDVAVGWTRLDPHKSEGDLSRRVEAWVRTRVGGDWRDARRISTKGSQAALQDVVLDDDGDGWVMYTEDSSMYLRKLHRGGRVGGARYLGSGDHHGSLAVDGSGNALAVWTAWAGVAEEVVVARYAHRSGDLEAAATLGPQTNYRGAPSAALSHDGASGVVAFGAYQWALAARMTAPGELAPAETLISLPDTEQVVQVRAFVDDTGTGTVLLGTGGVVDHAWLYAVRLPQGEAPTEPWPWASGRFTEGFGASMDRSGDIQVGWVELTSTPDGWRHPGYTLRIPAGKAPGEATRVAADTWGVSLALRRNGSGYVGWLPRRVDARPRMAPMTDGGSVGSSTRSPVLFETVAQVRRAFLVAYERSAPDLGSDIWVRRGP